MKICLTITRFKEDLREAISKNFVLLAEKLQSDTDLQITSYTPLDYKSSFTGKKIVFSKNQHYDSIKDNLSNVVRIAKYINEEARNYDVFNIHIGPLYELFILKSIIKKENRPKVVVSIWQPYLESSEVVRKKRYYLSNWFENKHHFLLNSGLNSPIYKAGARAFDHLVVQTFYQEKQLHKLIDKSKVQVIHNGLADVNDKKAPRELTGPATLLYIGHMKTSKGCDIIIKLLSLLVKQCEVKLIIATSNRGNHKEIEDLIEKLEVGQFIEWKGKVDVYKEMSEADAFLVPYQSSVGTSYYPNVLLEALGVGVPIVTSSIGSIPEIIIDNKTGILIDPENLEIGCEKLVALLQDSVATNKMSETQRAMFEERFTIDLAVKSYHKKFQEVAQLTA